MCFSLSLSFFQKQFHFIEMFMILWRGMEGRLLFLGNLQQCFLNNCNYNQLSLALVYSNMQPCFLMTVSSTAHFFKG